MEPQMLNGVVRRISVVHKSPYSVYKGSYAEAGLTVFAITSKRIKIRLCIIEGLDSLDSTTKVAMMEEFFRRLIGREIYFYKGPPGRCSEVEDNFLPEELRLSYAEIKVEMWEWFQKNRNRKPTVSQIKKNLQARDMQRKKRALEFSLPEDASWEMINQAGWEARKRAEEEAIAKKELERQERALKVSLPEDASWELIREIETKKRNEEREEEQRKFDEEYKKFHEDRRKNALQLTFQLGRNPKHGYQQWEARHNGRLYVLAREDRYIRLSGRLYKVLESEDNSCKREILVDIVRELVPGRIILVQPSSYSK